LLGMQDVQRHAEGECRRLKVAQKALARPGLVGSTGTATVVTMGSTDIATLGLAIDSSQVKTATGDLKNFKTAAD